MNESIQAEFNREDLPEWARKHKEVFWLSERDLAFRMDVFRATETQYRRFLIRQAKRRYAQAHGVRVKDLRYEDRG